MPLAFGSCWQGADLSTPTTGLDYSTFNHGSLFGAPTSLSATAPLFGVSGFISQGGSTFLTIPPVGGEFAPLGDIFYFDSFIMNTSQNNMWIASVYDAPGNNRCWGIRTSVGGNNLNFVYSSNGIATTELAGVAVNVDVILATFNAGTNSGYYHFAVISDGTLLSFYVNGVRTTFVAAPTFFQPASNSLNIAGAVGSTRGAKCRLASTRYYAGSTPYPASLTTIPVPTLCGPIAPGAFKLYDYLTVSAPSKRPAPKMPVRPVLE